MGSGYRARCLDCEKKFMVREGVNFMGGFVRCDKCGRESGFGAHDDQDLFFEYAHLLINISYRTNDNIKDYDPETRQKIKKCREIEKKLLGKCKCGGNFTYFAPPRCPKCHSTRIEDTFTEVVCYD